MIIHWIQDLFECPLCGSKGIFRVTTDHINTITDNGLTLDDARVLDEFVCRRSRCRAKIANRAGRTFKNAGDLLAALQSGEFIMIKDEQNQGGAA